MSLPTSHLLTPSIPQHQTLKIPSLSFLIENTASKRKLLFDLGLRKDPSSLPPTVLKFLSDSDWDLSVDENVSDILSKHNISPDEIEAVILSHHHFDHVGDLSQFSKTTDIVVGPDFKTTYLPGWPINPDSSLIDADWKGRNIQEISIQQGANIQTIGGFQAVDYFGDGSLFLLNAPGHTIGHLAALARVTVATDSVSGSEPHARDTFVFLAGDICHYPGTFRPSEQEPLDSVTCSRMGGCPAAFYLDIHPQKSLNQPFYEMPADATVDEVAAKASIQRLCQFDANEDVLVIIGHDASLAGKIGLFPVNVNNWKAEGVKDRLHWSFLRDFGRDTTTL
ncbi:uncharacterized protein N7511_009420 [Penicillium nucicola]|uniref:uncharacterized protein n=1 Tax=Penicillium nucicola TaxID=1850975 RepID=UPI002545981B|nr:uncharacterized protein N7511_009420 [Penicillium nucicola]KAJ5747724.1 hypothetical protein N7511_009420 [Penicillium nucicola]